jgi:hypothetical protein
MPSPVSEDAERGFWADPTVSTRTIANIVMHGRPKGAISLARMSVLDLVGHDCPFQDTRIESQHASPVGRDRLRIPLVWKQGLGPIGMMDMDEIRYSIEQQEGR